ncbi:hypothetical protein [Sphingomonas panacis]|uniref:hypothetical protein n=1 Tax=Sphingomonas panacis TaxID=1560345 RepID=UPI0012371C81|nr:hypothetical protein [Sphingomonas panacis]
MQGRHVAGRVPPGDAGRGWSGVPALSRAVRGGFFALLVLALWLQGCFVAAHVHEQPRSIAFSAATGADIQRAPLDRRRSPTTPDSCPLCQEIATAGAYLPAPSVEFALPTQHAAWYAAMALGHTLPHQRSHAWRSRGPPAAPHL